MCIRKSVGFGVWLALASALACQKTPPRELASEQQPEHRSAPEPNASPARTAPQARTDTAAPAESAPLETPAVEQARSSAPTRVVAIGDLHGDLSATRDVLQLVGAIDERDRWVGGKLTVVQTGDQLDRGDDERGILDLLHRLGEQARAQGGKLLVLNGNHETMNAMGDFRYVTPGAREDFADVDARQLPAEVAAQLPADLRGRAAAFLPGGSYAQQLAERPLIALVDDTVFVHGGVHLDHVKYGIDRINRETAQWLEGSGPAPDILTAEDGPVWSRIYSEPTPSPQACQELGRVLEAVGAKRMVVGHTVQRQGITSACSERVWRIDVGMSSYYGGDRVMALQIEDGKVTVLERAKSDVLAPAAE